MIWVMLEGHGVQGWISLGTIPIETEQDYTCEPEGLVDLVAVQSIGEDIRLGSVWGCAGGMRWYRQAGVPRMRKSAPVVESRRKACPVRS